MKKATLLFLFVFWAGSLFGQKDMFDIARSGSVSEMQAVIRKDPKVVNSVNADGYSLLTLAVYRSNNEVAKLLIASGADVNGKSNYGTPLMAAIVKGNEELSRILLKHKADTSITDASGNTALIYAVLFKKYDLVTLLIEAKADINLTDIRGKSALDYAKISGDEKLVELFNH